jgi:hypothetical protein
LYIQHIGKYVRITDGTARHLSIFKYRTNALKHTEYKLNVGNSLFGQNKPRLCSVLFSIHISLSSAYFSGILIRICSQVNSGTRFQSWFGEFSPIGPLLTLGSLLEVAEVSQFLGVTLAHSKKLCIHFDKIWVRLHFRWFFYKLIRLRS